MGVRIYQLSKQLEITNKELITLLQERGFEVSSPSNTIPNLYADSFLEEFNKKAKPEEEKEDSGKKAPEKETGEESLKKAEDEKAEEEAKKPVLPVGKFVRSAQEVELEKQKSKRPPVEPFRPAANTPPSPSGLKKPPEPPRPKAPMSPGEGAGKAPRTPQIKPSNKELREPQVTLPAFTKKASDEKKPATLLAEATGTLSDASSDEDDKPLKTVHAKPPIVVRDFAVLIDCKPFRLISELMELGIFASMNQTIEEELAIKIARKHGFLLTIHHRGEPVAESTPPKQAEEEIDESKLMERRPPVVCVLGHVDHGKTTLLDTIRKTKVVAKEAGGITQHIGAYQVDYKEHKITFIDTPGHAAFSKMRERGAVVTDIAILVVAADDGFKPQTDEALKFAQRANVPIIVAINKSDAKGANIDKVKQQMQERGIASEDWGGEVLCTPVSALKGEKIDDLLELILLQSEMEELRANPKCPAAGIVLESQIEAGRGSTATVIIQKGTLKRGDAIVCGGSYCKVRAMITAKGERANLATPSMPINILGWSSIPQSGSSFQVVRNEKEARRSAERNAYLAKQQLGPGREEIEDLSNLLDVISSAQQLTFNVVIKGDVHGSVEALKMCLESIHSDKITLKVINADAGLISKKDLGIANAANACIIGFNTKLENGVLSLAKHDEIRIIQHNIIYELIDVVKEAMTEMLEPELQEHKIGIAEVRQVFSLSRGSVAGCMVTEGRIVRDSFARVMRKEKSLQEGKVSALKRFKEDATEVRAGYECGIQINNFNQYQEGDLIECFEIKKIRPTL